MREREPKTSVSPRLIVGGVVVLLALVFIVENSKKTKIRFLIPEVTAPLWVGLTAAGLLGAFAGGLTVHLLADRQKGRTLGRRRDREPPPSA